MAVVAGVIFFIVRAFFALIPGLAGRAPVKKWVALAALAIWPAGTDPIVLGESANTITTYGYDPATGMQEAKVTLCQITAA